MPGIIPEINPELDLLVNYDPTKNPFAASMLRVTDTDLDDDEEEFEEVVFDKTTALQNAHLTKNALNQQRELEEEQRKKALKVLK